MELEKIKLLSELINASLSGKKIEKVPSGLDFDELIELASKQKMQTMLLKPLLGAEGLSEKQAEYIKNACMRSFIKSANQLHDVDIIDKALEGAGLKHQFLKGTILKDIYPNKELRDMGDIDILVDEDELGRVDEVLAANGFTMSKSVKHHDIYVKNPFTVLEVHRYLSEDKHLGLDCRYFREGGNNLLVDGTGYTYRYSSEYFYIFMIMHMARHFYERGCGVRGLVDLYVYKNRYAGEMDDKYLDAKLKEYHLYDFEKHMDRLSQIWLGGGQWTSFYENLFDYMIDGDVYGKEENGIWSQFAREKTVEDSKLARLKLRMWYLFPSYQYMANYNEWLRGKPYLLPVAWFYRATHVSKKHRFRQNLANSADSAKIHSIQHIYKEMNFAFRE